MLEMANFFSQKYVSPLGHHSKTLQQSLYLQLNFLKGVCGKGSTLKTSGNISLDLFSCGKKMAVKKCLSSCSTNRLLVRGLRSCTMLQDP